MSKRKTLAVVLAAGLGKRMKSHFPKVLHEVGGSPMISHVIDSLLNIKIDSIVVVIGYKAPLVQRYIEDKYHSSRISFVEQKNRLGTAHAVKMAHKYLKSFDGDLIICCGDVPLMREGTFKSLIHRKRTAKCSAVVLAAKVDDPTDYGRIVTDKEGVRIVEDKDCTVEELNIKLVNTGTYCFDCQTLLKILPKIKNDNNQKEYYITDAIHLIRKMGAKTSAAVLEDPTEMIGINSRRHLAEANSILQSRIIQTHMDNGVTIVDPSSVYIEKKVTIGKDSIIYPFTVLRGKTEIGENCRIGPFVSLTDTHIDHGEVETP